MMEDDPLINKRSDIINEPPGARGNSGYYSDSQPNGPIDVIAKHDKKQVSRSP